MPQPDRSDKPQIPTHEETLKLPRWAHVAFAARCARRVQPLFKVGWPDAPLEDVEAVNRMIQMAEWTVAQPDADRPHARADAARARVYVAAGIARADVAACAARAAARANDAAEAAAPNAAFDAAFDAASAAVSAARAAAPGIFEVVIAGIRRDFDSILRVAEDQRWTDETHVPANFFGPMWPHGEPPGWPERNVMVAPHHGAGSAVIPVTVLISPGAATKYEIGELLAEISILYRMMGGSGIQFTVTDVRVPEGVLA